MARQIFEELTKDDPAENGKKQGCPPGCSQMAIALAARALVEPGDPVAADCFLLEDDPYAELGFEGEVMPPLASMMPERTLYLGTFSKILAPGIRLGYVAAPQEVIRKLVQAKQGMDLHTSAFVQMVACEVGRMGILPAHIEIVRGLYRERCEAMHAAMDRHFPEALRRTRPTGGLFLWVTLPEPLDSVELLPQAVAEGVAYVPGPSFYPSGLEEARRHLRLNFSFCGPERIEEGIRRLGAVFTRAMRTSAMKAYLKWGVDVLRKA